MRRLFRKERTLSYSDPRMGYEKFINSELNTDADMINNPKNIFWDIETKNFALLVTLANGNKIILTDIPSEVITMLSTMISAMSFGIKVDGTLVAITSSHRHNSALLLVKNIKKSLENHIDIDDSIKVLVSDRINLPLYIGHFSSIERLVDNSDFKYVILALDEVTKSE